MPRISNIVEQLTAIDIQLLEPFTNSKQHHDMQCMNCGFKFNATPNSKIQVFKKYGAGGCPECTRLRHGKTKDNKRQDFISKINSKGFEILTDDYDGNQLSTTIIQVKRKLCSHVFTISPTNLVHNDTECPVCNGYQSNGDV